MSMLHEKLTSRIIKAFYNVYNQLGYGFLERVYENAMMIELDNLILIARQQAPIEVLYNDQLVGNFFADILVEEKVVVELKAVSELLPIHEAQLMNYLKGTNLNVGLLLNFGPQPKVIRKIYDI